jgi:hypothetical protein
MSLGFMVAFGGIALSLFPPWGTSDKLGFLSGWSRRRRVRFYLACFFVNEAPALYKRHNDEELTPALHWHAGEHT